MAVSPGGGSRNLEKEQQEDSTDADLATLQREARSAHPALPSFRSISSHPRTPTENCAHNDSPTLAGYRRLLAALREPEPPTLPTAAPESKIGPHRVRLRIVKGEEVTAFDALTPVTLREVGGQESVKGRLREVFLAPLASTSAASQRRLRGGTVLWGPPGCGKTFLARALAGELGASCLRVAVSELADGHAWDIERKLRHTLVAVRGHAPAVLFFDDLDALGPRLHDADSPAVRRLINRFLLGLYDLLAQEERVCVLAATARPWEIEPALRRAGCFDQLVFVPPPDIAARAALLRAHLRRGCDDQVDFQCVARQTEHMSIADLQQICRMAAGKGDSPRDLDTIDLLRALPTVRASTRGWLESARNFALFGNSGGDYTELREYMRLHALL